MVPKIIHLCWLSGDEYPDSIRKCLDSWHEHLPNYEIWLWDTKRFDIHSTKWTEQAFETKKYAFAADYIRLYALYHYGGIYLDSDVEVYKSFDELLHFPYFIGEDFVHCFEPAIIGAEPHQEWIKVVLDRYEGLEFINPDGSYNMRGLPVVFHDRLVPRYQFRKVSIPLTVKAYQYDGINVFPFDYFNSRNFIGSIKTENSYCSHNYVGSWLKPKKKISSFAKRFVPHPLLNQFYSLMFRFIWDRGIKNIQIPYV